MEFENLKPIEIENGQIIRYFEYGDTGAMERGYTG